MSGPAPAPRPLARRGGAAMAPGARLSAAPLVAALLLQLPRARCGEQPEAQTSGGSSKNRAGSSSPFPPLGATPKQFKVMNIKNKHMAYFFPGSGAVVKRLWMTSPSRGRGREAQGRRPEEEKTSRRRSGEERGVHPQASNARGLGQDS